MTSSKRETSSSKMQLKDASVRRRVGGVVVDLSEGRQKHRRAACRPRRPSLTATLLLLCRALVEMENCSTAAAAPAVGEFLCYSDCTTYECRKFPLDSAVRR